MQPITRPAYIYVCFTFYLFVSPITAGTSGIKSPFKRFHYLQLFCRVIYIDIVWFWTLKVHPSFHKMGMNKYKELLEWFLQNQKEDNRECDF